MIVAVNSKICAREIEREKKRGRRRSKSIFAQWFKFASNYEQVAEVFVNE